MMRTADQRWDSASGARVAPPPPPTAVTAHAPESTISEFRLE